MPPRRECFGSAESEKICGNELAFAFHVRGEIRSSNSFPCFSYGGYKPLRATVARGSSRLCEIFHKRSLHTSNFPASNLVNSYLVSISSAANSRSARSRNFRSCRESSSPQCSPDTTSPPCAIALYLSDQPSHGYHSFGCNFIYPASKKNGENANSSEKACFDDRMIANGWRSRTSPGTPGKPRSDLRFRRVFGSGPAAAHTRQLKGSRSGIVRVR